MADGGPLERQDLISDDALKAPGILTEEFQKLLDKLDDVVKKSQEYGSSFSSADASTAKLKESTAGLSDEQRVLGQITTQINTLIAKQSDEYIEQVGVLNQLKQATKDKTALGEQEAQSVTRENASRNQLLAALNSNRAAYSNLRNEQARNSPEGQKLLKVIQDQDKAFKDLSKGMGDNKVLVGSYRSEIEELIGKFGKVSPELVETTEKASGFGKVIQAALSPLGLVIGSIAAAVGITKASLDVFYEDSIQGADALSGKFNSWKALLEIIKDSLFEFGKSSDSWIGKLIDNMALFIAYATKGAEGIAELQIKQAKLDEATRLQNEIKKEEIKLTVELSELTLEKEDELFIARDKANQQLDDRYEALQKAKALGKEILADRLGQIQNEIRLQQELISVNTKRSVVGLTANQILAQSNELGRVNYEQLEKLAGLEAQLNQIQSDKLKGSRRNQALEASIIDEAIKRQVDFEKALVDSQQKASSESIKVEKESADRIKQNQFSTWHDRLEALKTSIQKEDDLNDVALQQAVRTEMEKYVALVTLDKATHDKIKEQAGDDLEKRAELELNAKKDLVLTNTNYTKVVGNLYDEFNQKRLGLDKKYNAEEIILQRERAKQILEIEKQLGSQLISTTVTIANFQYDAQQSAIDQQLTQLDDWHNKELALVGDNSAAKLRIDEEYNRRQANLQKEQADIKKKQAIFDKAASAIEVAFKTSVAIMEAVAASPLTGGMPWSGLAATIGALQEAAILAKPIPQYQHGTKSHRGGLAVLGDGGMSELFVTPQGVAGLSPSQSTLIDLPENSQVFSGNMTTRMLAMMGLGVPERLDKAQQLDNSIVKELRRTNQLLSKPSYHTSIESDGTALIVSHRNASGLLQRIRKNVMVG